ncbi:MAG: hypothetical protein FWC41_07365, partial [Firmicutes bacterium]|nr:hypothetical protein [Bacillota bacterium]
MKIVIHGTSGGYGIFTSEKITGLIDARRDSSKVAAIGQQAYSINFIDGNVIFSKYKIIRDVIGDKRTGNIAFSVVIPNNRKLSGEDVVMLLNQLSDIFCQKHISVNDNLDSFREDWTFVDDLKNEYERKLNPNDEEMKSGTDDAAFVYYSDGIELQKYFAAPYQEEYSPYKQVFFIERRWEEKDENPLNALRHNPSSEIKNIDLENPRYKLKDFEGQGKDGVKIEIWRNDERFSKRKNDFIKRKDTVKIRYSKDDRYYIPIDITKKLTDDEILGKYLFIVDESKVSVKNDVVLQKVERVIPLTVKDRKGNAITDAKVICKKSFANEEKKDIVNEIKFEGEELKESWVVYAKKDDNLYSERKTITPEIHSGELVLILEERKTIKINVIDGNNSIVNFEIWKNNRKEYLKNSEIEFIEDEINNLHTFTIRCNGYEDKSVTFSPATCENPLYIKLEKRTIKGQQESRYLIDEGEHGRKKSDCPAWSKSKNGDDVKDYIIPFKRYEFSHFDLKNDILTAKYRKRELPFYKKPVFIIGGGVVIIAVVVLCILIFGKKGNNEQENEQAIAKKINSYVEGVVLNADTLNKLEKDYCKGGTFIPPSKKEPSFFQRILPFGKKSRSTTTNSEKPEYCKKLSNAIVIRSAINVGNIDDLKNKVGNLKGNEQQRFITTVNSIDTKFKDKIGQIMKADTVSRMNLNQIADYILNLQKLLQIREDVKQLTKNDKDKLESKKNEIDNIIFPIDSIKTNIKTEIDNKISKQQQNQNQQQQQQNNQTSRQNQQQQDTQLQQQTNSLETEFWNLVQKITPSKTEFDNLFKKTGWNNDYKTFYNKYLSKRKNTNLTNAEKQQGWVGFDDG